MTDQQQSPSVPEPVKANVVRRALWFLAGAGATFAAFLALATSNVTGIREEPRQGKPAVHFSLDETGGSLLAELTRKNMPTGGDEAAAKRRLAIIVDGVVFSAPTINGEIGRHGQINGEFSNEELDDLVNALRAGRIQGPILHPNPVMERTLNEAKIPGGGGGRILVYQIDLRLKGEAQRDPTTREKADLVEMLQRFVSYGSAFEILVRPTGRDLIEIILPNDGKRPFSKEMASEECKRIKQRVRKLGLLELRILANSEDDKAAIEDAMKRINHPTPEMEKDLQHAQSQGLPPLGAGTGGGGGKPNVYEIALANDAKSRVTYSWVGLGLPLLRSLKLDPASKDDPKRNGAWKEAAKFRGKATTLADPDSAGTKLLHGALFYSRECKDQNLTAKELAEKPFEYFVLARNPEIDLATNKVRPRIDGSHLVNAYKNLGADDPFYRRNRIAADFAVLGMLAVFGVVHLFVQRRLRLRWELLIGQWVAILAGTVYVLAR